MNFSSTKGLLIAGLICTLPFLATGAMLDDFSHSEFAIESVSQLENQSISASYSSDLGNVQAQYSVLAARARMASGTLTFEAFFYGTGSVTYTFANPISLESFAYLDLPFQHPYSYNPIAHILIYLESGARLDLNNYTTDPIAVGRTRFPFYLFQSAFDFRLHELARVTRISFVFSVTGTQSPPLVIPIDHISLVAGGAIPVPTFSVRSRNPSGFWMETREAIGIQYVYRLEATDDFVNWYIKYDWQRGHNAPFQSQGSFSDSPFRRLRLFHYVE